MTPLSQAFARVDAAQATYAAEAMKLAARDIPIELLMLAETYRRDPDRANLIAEQSAKQAAKDQANG